MEVIRAKEKHIGEIMNLLDQVLTVHQKIRPDLMKQGTTKYTPEELKVILNDEKRPVFVAVENDKVLGHCFCVIEEHKANNEVPRTELYIDDLCIDESVRGTGVGKEIYEYVKDWAKQKGFYRLTLHVWEGNDRAMGFYEAMGFTTYMKAMEEIL